MQQDNKEQDITETVSKVTEDPLQQMIELLAQMQQLESILKATKQEIQELESSTREPSSRGSP
jgi:hypothetical protein